jgi:hypothetical protein
MPSGIAPADRKLLLIGGALLILLVVASALIAPPSEQMNSPIPSTYSAQSAGAQAAYTLLSRLHYPVRRWEQPPTELGGDPESESVLLILAQPMQPPSTKERQALADFVAGGGHVFFTGANIRDYFPHALVSSIPPDPAWKTFSPSLPNRFAPAAQRVTMQPLAYWGQLQGAQLQLYGDSDEHAVVSWKLGDGEILWWAGSTPLTNAGITRDDNLPFFLNSVANWKTSGAYRIYWDEYFHGQRSSVWSYIDKTSLPWSLAQLGLLAIAVLLTFSRRSGPTYVPAPVSRLSPLEFVDTLGGLYERAGAASSAVAISYARLRSLLTRHLSLPGNIPDDALAQSAEQRMGWKNSGLGELLRSAQASSRAPKLRPGEALELVQKMETQGAQLAVRSPIRREKN